MGDPAGAFALLNEKVLPDFARNPSRASALDLDEVQPEMFRGRPEILVPLALELILRGAFERGARAYQLADQADVDYRQQPVLAVRQEMLRAFYLQVVGQLDESLSHVSRAHELADGAVDDGYLLAGLDVVELYAVDLPFRVHTLAGTGRCCKRGRRQPSTRPGGALRRPEEPGRIPRGIPSGGGEPG